MPAGQAGASTGCPDIPPPTQGRGLCHLGVHAISTFNLMSLGNIFSPTFVEKEVGGMDSVEQRARKLVVGLWRPHPILPQFSFAEPWTINTFYFNMFLSLTLEHHEGGVGDAHHQATRAGGQAGASWWDGCGPEAEATPPPHRPPQPRPRGGSSFQRPPLQVLKPPPSP